MAVEESFRGKGIGAGLMGQAEQAALALPAHTVTMHARLSARGFYERLEYRAVSDVFTQVTVPHIVMEKALAQENP